jgi:ribosomal protein S18 acetylase RimI-like enzyme
LIAAPEIGECGGARAGIPAATARSPDLASVRRKADPGPPGVVIRDARADDLAAVVRLDAEATGLRKAAYWKGRLAWYSGGHRDRFFLVACRGEETVGFILGDVRAWEFGAPPSGWIFAINVKRSARLARVGTLLFDALCARFRAAGVDIVRTMPSKDAQLILSFFRSQGLMAGPFVLLEKRLDP